MRVGTYLGVALVGGQNPHDHEDGITWMTSRHQQEGRMLVIVGACVFQGGCMHKGDV